MKKFLLIALIIAGAFAAVSLTNPAQVDLREIYSAPPETWPAPFVDSHVDWKELAALPKPDTSRFAILSDPKVVLGRTLFFDPRLSGSNQISCSSCHDPDLSWTDGRQVSLGHDHLQGSRNTPSLLNIAAFNEFFWDGRASSLIEQALNPLDAHHEMAMDVSQLIRKLKTIDGYKPLFEKAYGSSEISMFAVLESIASFEKTIISRSSSFDEFLRGRKSAMTDEEIEGMHIFRTKARCMNCHHGTYLTDMKFHNIGLTYYGKKYEDLGRYHVTGEAADVGKFKTPSLRDVMRTRPWMHNGIFDNMEGIINMYSNGMPQPKPRPEQVSDPLFPKTDPLIQRLDLNSREKKSLLAFLNAITTSPFKVNRPDLPK